MNEKFNLTERQSGQTLIEVVVALALGIIIIVALVGLGTRANRDVNSAKVAEIASKFAQEGQEVVKQIRDSDGPVSVTSPAGINSWTDLYTTNIGSKTLRLILGDGSGSCPVSIWCLDESASADTAPDTGGVVVDRIVVVSDLSGSGFDQCKISGTGLDLDFDEVKSVLVRVTWTDPSGPHEINLQSCLTRKT